MKHFAMSWIQRQIQDENKRCTSGGFLSCQNPKHLIPILANCDFLSRNNQYMIILVHFVSINLSTAWKKGDYKQLLQDIKCSQDPEQIFVLKTEQQQNTDCSLFKYLWGQLNPHKYFN